MGLKAQKIFILVCYLFVFCACGKKTLNSSHPQISKGQSNFTACYKLGAHDDDLFKEIKEAIARAKSAQKIQASYNHNIIGEFHRPLLPANMNQSALNPQIYNGKIIKTEFESLKMELQETLFGYRILFSMEPLEDIFHDIDGLHARDLTTYVQRLNGLLELSYEWKEDICNLDILKEKKVIDVRPYIFLNKRRCVGGNERNVDSYKCVEQTIEHWDYGNSIDPFQDLIFSNFSKVCNIVRSQNDCSLYWGNYQHDSGMRVEYYNETIDKFRREVYQKYFDLINTTTKFDCRRNQSAVTVRLPITLANIPDNKREQIRSIFVDVFNEYWYQQNSFAVDLVWLDSRISQNVVSIQFGQGSSHVSQADPLRISLSDRLLEKPDLLKRELAHEIGHVFGLNDCYAKFYDSATEEIVYYELDFKNIMCSTKRRAHVSDRSIQLIKNFKCR